MHQTDRAGGMAAHVMAVGILRCPHPLHRLFGVEVSGLGVRWRLIN
jgi:hypothetical protein